MRTLHVWSNGKHIGVFSEGADGHVGFSYDDSSDNSAGAPPISVSLPRSGGWKPDAPRNFLDNLLDSVDATGGLTFSLSSASPDHAITLRVASEEEIANEISRIEHTPNLWWDENGHCRFSRGGAQGKFTLTDIDGQWLWPDAGLPSTHIVKPRPKGLKDALAVEQATMDLADACGLDAPQHGEMVAASESAYIVERFDRVSSPDGILRIRQEDLLQALGRPSSDKYEVGAGAPGEPPSSRGLDQYARNRGQDQQPDPPGHRRRHRPAQGRRPHLPRTPQMRRHLRHPENRKPLPTPIQNPGHCHLTTTTQRTSTPDNPGDSRTHPDNTLNKTTHNP